MKLVITHLTRMGYPRVCVAGIEPVSGRYIRPVTGREEPLTLDAVHSGLLRLGQVIELGPCRVGGRPPEVEDCWFSLGKAQVVEQLSPKAFWSRLEASAQGSLAEVFGEGLRPHRTTLALPAGTGRASLGDLRVEGLRLRVEVHQNQASLRAHFRVSDCPDELSVAVVDLRFYKAWGSCGYRLDVGKVNWVNRALRSSRAILSVGLSRAKALGGQEPLHWLQVNGVHLESDPLWAH
ncbi:MAG: hypothetical protein NZ849_09610 [Meiothermus sp.]|uniref:dual OB domain-containing protein n=1 Tax=Meiothermus sp. TaxID=1955249 RepID=UPI0025FF8EC0|nr:hypothetical protein [Meiothermus sp.]MCS7195147.1 hypothetical protein [Meiothermus sp.]